MENPTNKKKNNGSGIDTDNAFYQSIKNAPPAGTSGTKSFDLSADLNIGGTEGTVSTQGEKLNRFLQTHKFEIERDPDVIRLVDSFYQRYAVSYYSENESEKASHLKVKVKVTEHMFVHLTRDELDRLLSEYRMTYKSFCNLRTYLSAGEVQMFDRWYNVREYISLREKYRERMVFVKSPEIEVRWETEDKTTLSGGGLRTSESDTVAREYIVGRLFPTDMVAVIRDRLFGGETSTNIVLGMLVEKHREFVNFMLRVNKDVRAKAVTAVSGRLLTTEGVK